MTQCVPSRDGRGRVLASQLTEAERSILQRVP